MPHNCQFKRQSMNEYAQLAVHWLTDWMIASQSSLDAWLNIEITVYIAMSIQVKLLPPPIDVNSWSCAGVRSMKSFVLSSKCIGDVMFPPLSLYLLYILLWLTSNIAGSWPVLRCQTAGWKHLVLGSLGCFHFRNLFTQVWCDYPAALVYCFYAQVTRTAHTLRFHLPVCVWPCTPRQQC